MTTVTPGTLAPGTHTQSDVDHKPVVPAYLKKFGVSQGLELPPVNRLRLYIQGMPGTGKTTFAASIPGSIHLDPEDSARFVQHPKGIRAAVRSGSELAGVIDALIAAKATPTLNHVVFDTIEKCVELFADHLTVEHNKNFKNPVDDIRNFGKDGAGWGLVNRYVLDRLQKLYDAGFGWTVCGHLKEDIMEDPVTKKQSFIYRGLVNPGIRAGCYRDAQYVVRIRAEVRPEKVMRKAPGLAKEIPTSVNVKHHVLELTASPAGGTITQVLKDRLGGYLPSSLTVTGDDGWDVFTEAYEEACKKAQV